MSDKFLNIASLFIITVASLLVIGLVAVLCTIPVNYYRYTIPSCKYIVQNNDKYINIEMNKFDEINIPFIREYHLHKLRCEHVPWLADSDIPKALENSSSAIRVMKHADKCDNKKTNDEVLECR